MSHTKILQFITGFVARGRACV